MQLRDYVELVLPGSGPYVVFHATQNGNSLARPINEVVINQSDVIQTISSLEAAGRAVFLALGNLKRPGYQDADGKWKIRTAANIESLNAVFIDLDTDHNDPTAKKPYPNKQAALLALVQACKAGLPAPSIVVDSGNGIHAYWTFKKPLPVPQWYKVADRFHTWCKNLGLHPDPSITRDCTSVLRPIGTSNKKRSAVPVRALGLGTGKPVNLMSWMSTLKSIVPIERVDDKKSASKLETFSRAKVPFANLKATCGQVAAGIANPDQVPEPFWMYLMQAAMHTIEGEAAALEISKGYSRFNKAEFDFKINHINSQNLLIPTCARMQTKSPWPEICDQCEWLKLNQSAVSAVQQAAQRTQQYADTSTQAQTGAAAEALDDGQPAYSWDTVHKYYPKGVVAMGCQLVKMKTLTIDGEEVTLKEVFASFVVLPIAVYEPTTSVKGYQIRFKILSPTGQLPDVVIEKGILANPPLLAMQFNQQTRAGGISDIKLFCLLINKMCFDLYRLNPTTPTSQNGWVDDGFVIGDEIIKKAGSDRVTIGESLKDIASGYEVKGAIEPFVHVTEYLNTLSQSYRSKAAFVIGAYLAAPLIKFSNIKGCILALSGPSGSGKTTLAEVGQAVWGDPKHVTISSKSTEYSIYQTLGLLRNLPMTLDEVSLMRSPDMVLNLAYAITQGTDARRLTQASELKAVRGWESIIVCTSNVPISALYGKTQIETDAQQARIFNLEFYETWGTQQQRTFTRLINELRRNHGQAGRVMLQYYVENRDNLSKVVESLESVIREKAGVDSEYRFWCGLTACVCVALQVASRLGLISFDPVEVSKWAIERIKSQSQRHASLFKDHGAALTYYIIEFAQNLFPTGADSDRALLSDPSVRGIAGRFSADTLFIDKKAFDVWAMAHGYQPDSVCNSYSHPTMKPVIPFELFKGTAPVPCYVFHCPALISNLAAQQQEAAAKNVQLVQSQLITGDPDATIN